MTPRLSVVIPTFNRRDTLPRVLDALGRQTLATVEYEVVVVDDGSSDGTGELLAGVRAPFPLRAISQANTGPAGARNRGVRAAQGEIVVFLGDDTVPETGFLAAHRDAHAEAAGRSVSVLGYTGWPREWRVTPFLAQINEEGMQFGYGIIADPERVPFNFYYTSNISTPRRALLAAGLFDEGFPHAAWEDIELAYRLERRGFTIVYRPGAVARHYHRMTLSSFRRRQRKSGEAAAVFYEKHPELADFLAVGIARARRPRVPAAMVWLASLSSRIDAGPVRRAVREVLEREYLSGLRRGLERASGGGRSGAPGGHLSPARGA